MKSFLVYPHRTNEGLTILPEIHTIRHKIAWKTKNRDMSTDTQKHFTMRWGGFCKHKSIHIAL